jgi:hypothetical protein
MNYYKKLTILAVLISMVSGSISILSYVGVIPDKVELPLSGMNMQGGSIYPSTFEFPLGLVSIFGLVLGVALLMYLKAEGKLKWIKI